MKKIIILLLISVIILLGIDIAMRLGASLNMSNIINTIDKKTFENLYRAGKAITGATEVGVNYEKLNGLMQDLNTEVSICKDKKLNSKEEMILGLYEDAIKCYQDSMILWRAIIERHVDNIRLTRGDDEEYLRSLKPMLSKYGIEITEVYSELAGRNHPQLPQDALSKIWIYASEKIKKANTSLNL